MNFPTKDRKTTLTIEDLTSFLLEIQSNGLNVYSLEDRDNQFEIELTNTKTIRCIMNRGECQVQLLSYKDPLKIDDVVDRIQLEI